MVVFAGSPSTVPVLITVTGRMIVLKFLMVATSVIAAKQTRRRVTMLVSRIVHRC